METAPLRDELIQELAHALGIDNPPPDPEEGWMTLAELKLQYPGYTADKIRERLEKLVDLGKIEKMKWSRTNYYRMRKDE